MKKRDSKKRRPPTTRRCGLVDIPSDVIPNILSRLPLKSLCRFKCVSKTWRSLIITDIGHQSQRRPIFVVLCPNGCVEEYTGTSIYSIHPNGMAAHVCTSMSPPKHCFQQQYHGLLYYYRLAGDVVGVCNPITQEELTSPTYVRTLSLHDWRDPRFELGFDPLSCNYKVLNLTNYPYCEVYTLGSTSWRKLTKAVPFLRGCGVPSDLDLTICINGIIYLYCDKKHKLICFHLGDESFQALEVPSACRTSENSWVINLFEFEGCLCLENSYHSDPVPYSDSNVITLEFWMLKDFDLGWVPLAPIVPPSPAAALIRPYQTRAGEIALAVLGGDQPIFYLYSFLTQQFDAIKAVGLPCDFAVQDFEENQVSLKDL